MMYLHQFRNLEKMKKKLCICSILLLLIMFIAGTSYWERASSTRSKDEAYQDHLVKYMCFVLERSDYVHEVAINTETSPIQANIILSNSGELPPEVKAYIEKLITDRFPGAVIEFTELSPEEKTA